MAPLRYAAKFDPFLSLDCAPTPSTLAQSKETKGSNFAIWQPCGQGAPPDPGRRLGLPGAAAGLREQEAHPLVLQGALPHLQARYVTWLNDLEIRSLVYF